MIESNQGLCCLHNELLDTEEYVSGVQKSIGNYMDA